MRDFLHPNVVRSNGEWKNGIREGYGVYTWADGYKYEGDRYEEELLQELLDPFVRRLRRGFFLCNRVAFLRLQH